MRTLIALAIAAAATTAEARTSFPNAPMRQAGVMTCAIQPAMGLIVGSSRAVECRFVSNYGGFGQTYSGRMDRAGIDLGITSGQVISWRVMTPGGASRSGMLDGIFGGPSAEATILAGPGTQVGFVQDGDRVVLEPVAHSGHAGFSFALGEARVGLGANAPAVVR